ncbi:MAG: pseudaminic acid synthase [Rickettsiales bacterium]|jgi:pseudaminic acid synthase|nr:pseudaminic acid synthase [Rickettsiales bacterium]
MKISTAPFIIAEMSGNHNQSLERALALVDAAANAGADAVKLQTYKADTITLNVDNEYFRINDKDSLWKGRNLYDLYDEAHTPWEWHEAIFRRAKELNIIVFSSPFDETAVDFLEELDCPIYKIASFEIVHLPLIAKVAATGKPMIFSTGMSNLDEINTAYNTAKEHGAKDITILKCTSSYPADSSDANLVTIVDLAKRFPDCRVGLSDHTTGIGVAVAAVSYGATVIEKHFTLDRNDGGVDSAFSLEPSELRDLVIETKKAYKARGEVSYVRTSKEEKSLIFRPSIWITKDLKAGDILTKDSLIIRRPSYGINPGKLNDILGKKLKADLKFGEPLTDDNLE